MRFDVYEVTTTTSVCCANVLYEYVALTVSRTDTTKRDEAIAVLLD